MSDSVNHVSQCVWSAEAAPETSSNVYWSTAFAKAPENKSVLSIHFSRTSQLPMLTPRRNPVVEDVAVLVGVAVIEVNVASTVTEVEVG